MKELQNQKSTLMLRPQLKDDGDFANNTHLDTFGWRGSALVEFHVGDTDTTIGSVAEGLPPQLEWADQADFSDKSDITGAVLAAVISATDDNKSYAIEVDLSPSHKRYIRVKTPHAGDGTLGANLCIVGRQSVPEKGPINAAERGYAEYVIVTVSA